MNKNCRAIILLLQTLFLYCWADLSQDSRYQYQGHGSLEKDIKDQEHIKEHLKDEVDFDKMTDEQLHFHYFRMYDTNKDQNLDGVEIIHAMTHWEDDHDRNESDPQNNGSIPIMGEDQLEQTTDAILREADFDDNGLIAWSEFSLYIKKQTLEVEKHKLEEEKKKMDENKAQQGL